MTDPCSSVDVDPALVSFARARIAEELGGPPVVAPDDPRLREPGASFVTLHRADGRLHGCIGTLEARRPLLDDVEHNALAAAFYDPRGDALTLADVADVDVVISLLSPLEPMAVSSRAEACAALRPGIDGVVLRWRGHRGTLLPQVWAHVASPLEFLRALERKAGLPDGRWDRHVRLYRYTVRTAHDPGAGRAAS